MAWNPGVGSAVVPRMGPSTFRQVVAVGPTVLATAITTAVALRPDLVRLGHRFPGVGVAAWRPQLTAAAAVTAAVLAIRHRTRPMAIGLGIAALTTAPSVLRRVRRGPGAATAGPGETRLTVLSANVLVGRADTGALAALIAAERPDLVSLPEAGTDFRDKLVPLITDLGYRSWVSTARGTSDGAGVVVLASARAGELEVTTGEALRHRHLRATGGILGARSFFAVHPEAPMTGRRTALWRDDLARIGEWCGQVPAPIVAGDFNATVDHATMRAALGGCRSAADGTGRGLHGTFPASLPPAAGLQIDHVLIPHPARVTRFEIVEVAGSDHRAVLVDLVLPA